MPVVRWILWVVVVAVVSTAFFLWRASAPDPAQPWLINVGYALGASRLPMLEIKFTDLDEPTSLIIDTGSTLSSLDDETFEALTELGSIMPIGFAATRLGNGSENVVDLYRVLTDLSIGGCTYPADLGISWLYSKGGMGVIGQNILQTMAAHAFNTVDQRFVFVCPFPVETEAR